MRLIRLITFFLFFITFSIGIAFSGQLPPASPRPVAIDYTTARLSRVAKAVVLGSEDKILIDGKLNEPLWLKAEPAKDFIQQEPVTGAPATERTEVRFLYDSDNLYIGVRCFDSEPDKIITNEMKRDIQGTQEDNFVVYLDTLHDQRTGFFLGFNAAGGWRDGQVVSEGGAAVNYDWDGVWELKTTIDDQGWSAEVVLPFKTLRFTKASSQVWGLNLLRRVRRKNEDSNWSPLPRRFRTPTGSLAGTLVGLENIHQGRNLKIKPYVSSGITQVNNTANSGVYSTLKHDGGIDLKYGLTQSLTLDATYRTDFSQVEVDQQQVNLTRFSVLFPEKREFFLENSGIFNFIDSGNRDNLIPFFSRRIGLSASGDPIPIIGGGRISGKIGTYDVGVLAMKTQSLGLVPSNNFLVGRVKKNFLRRSYIGVMTTTRDSTVGGDYNRVYGADSNLYFDKLQITSYLLRSETPGKIGNNQARESTVAWIDDDLSTSGHYDEVQSNFNPEVGFIRRKNVRHYSADVSWRPRFNKSKVIRNLAFAPGADYYSGSSSGKVETRTQNFNTGVTFQNGAVINFNTLWTFDRLAKPFNIHSNVAIPMGDYNYRQYTFTANSDQSRKISGNLTATRGDFWNGRQTSVGGGLSLKPSYHLNVDITYSGNRVTLPFGSFTANLLGTKWQYAFGPKMYLNAFLQYNADTHQFISNIRYNIIHHPLSDLFIVYDDRHDTVTGKLIDRAFLVKVTNLFNF